MAEQIIQNVAPCCAVFYSAAHHTVRMYPVGAWAVDTDTGEKEPLITTWRGLVRIADHDGEDEEYGYIDERGWQVDTNVALSRFRMIKEAHDV